jgi:GAF domain-containing protein
LLVSLRTRKPVLRSQASADDLSAVRMREGDAELLRLVGLESLLAVPLIAHGLVVGALMLVSTAGSPHPTFDSVSVASAAAVANYSAQAIYNAQLFWEARLAVRTHAELVNAGSQDLLRLTANLKKRVNRLRTQVAGTPMTSPTVLNHGLSDIEDLAAGMLRCIRELAPIEIPGEQCDAV